MHLEELGELLYKLQRDIKPEICQKNNSPIDVILRITAGLLSIVQGGIKGLPMILSVKIVNLKLPRHFSRGKYWIIDWMVLFLLGRYR